MHMQDNCNWPACINRNYVCLNKSEIEQCMEGGKTFLGIGHIFNMPCATCLLQ